MRDPLVFLLATVLSAVVYSELELEAIEVTTIERLIGKLPDPAGGKVELVDEAVTITGTAMLIPALTLLIVLVDVVLVLV